MHIFSIVNKKVVTVRTGDSVLRAVKLMNRRRIGCVIVLRKRSAVGIITERDILMRIVAAKKSAEKTKCREIMSKPLITLESNKKIEDAIALLIRKKIKKLVVTKDGDFLGIITATDILRSGEKIEYAALKQLAEFFAIYMPEPQAG